MEPRPIDHVERAHLRDERGFSPPVHRLVPSPDLADHVRRYWLPVWSLPEGEVTVQRVLQYPVCLLVVTSDYATLVGPSSGLSTRELTGSGWAVGVMLQPAAGTLVSGRSVDQLADQVLPITEATGIDGARLTVDVRRVVGDAAADPEVRMQAVLVMEEALRALPPVDEEGLMVNAIVEYVEGDTEVQRVSQVCEKFAISERSLQRLTARRIGLGPKWLIQRRRLHEVSERLRGPEPPDLARVAADLGYSDQAHLTRDFRRVTGLTPGEFAGEPRA